MSRLPTIDEYGEDELIVDDFNSKLEDDESTNELKTETNEVTIQLLESDDESSEIDEEMLTRLERKDKHDRKIIRMLTQTMERKRIAAAKRRQERIQQKMNPIQRRSGSENPSTTLTNWIVKLVKNLTRRSQDSPSFVFFVDPSNVNDIDKIRS